MASNRAALAQLVENEDAREVKLADLANRQSKIAETVETIRNKIDGDLDQAQRSRDNALSELTAARNRLHTFETRLSSLPPKVRRKYDLDNL